MEEKQSTIEQLTRDIERHQKPIVEPQAANHDLRQELQQAQAEVEENDMHLSPARGSYRNWMNCSKQQQRYNSLQ